MAKFRRLIASLGIVAILSTLVVSSTAFAAFSDVPSDAWYAPFVTTLSEAGVLDTTKSTLNPGGNLNRAEALKLAVEVCGSTGTTDVPFADVKSTDWFYSYVQTGVANGITSGYPDGTFKPGNSVNRAEFAKFLVNACDLAESTDHPFTDVKSGDWFMKSVATAYHWQLVDGATATTFNPSGAITRAASFKMAAMSIDPKERAATVAPASTADSSPASTADSSTPAGPVGDLTVALNSASPKATTLPASASSVEVAKWDFTASSAGDATLSSLEVAKYGVASLASGHSLYLYDGTTRLTSARAVNSSTNVATFNSLGVKVAKGTTKTLTLVLDVGATSTTGEVGFQLAAAEAVVAGESKVGGTFPVKGEMFGLSTTAVGTVTIAKNGTVQNPKVGEDDVTIGKFKISAATEAASLKSIGIYVTGGVSPEALENLELYVSGTDEPIATVEGLNSKDIAVFVPETAYKIDKGATKSFWVKTDLNTGRIDDTIKVYIDETSDVVAIGGTYGFGMIVSMNTATTGYDGTTTACTSASGTCSFSTIEGGDITTTSSGPTAGDIAIDGDNVVLMNFNIASVADVTFKNFPIKIGVSEANAAQGLLKSVGSGTLTSNFTDIKIVNLETNETVMGPIDSNALLQTSVTGTAMAEGTATATDLIGYYLFTDQFDMSAGQTLKLALTLDVENNSTLDASTIYGAVDYVTSYPEIRDVNNKTVTNANVLVPSTAVTGKTMTVSTPKLTITRASTPVSDSYVKGAKNVKFVGMSFTCGTGSPCKVTDITMQGNYDDSGSDTWSTSGSQNSVNLNARVGSLALQDSTGNTIAASKGVQSDGSVAFTSLDWSLKAGETAILYAVGDISSNADGGESISFGIQAITDVTYEDKDGTTRNPVAGSIPNRGGAAGTDPDTFVSVLAGGSLTVAVDAGTDKEDIVVAGTADNGISKFKFTTTEEAFLVKKLSVNARQGGVASTNLGDYDNNISSVKISYTNSAGATETKTGYLTNGTANFSGMDWLIAKDDDEILSISATLNTVSGGATAGEFVDLNLAFNDFEAVAQSSGDTYKGDKINQSVDSASDLDFGTPTFVDLAKQLAAAGATVINIGTTETITVPDLNVSLPVGTLVKFGANSTTLTDATEPVIALTTAYIDNATSLVGTALNGGGDAEENDFIYYALPGTGYLTTAKQMHVYETKPTITLAATSPSGSKSVAASDNVFIFTIAASAQEKIQIRAATELVTCVSGAGSPGMASATASTSIDASGSCNIDGDSVAIVTADTVSFVAAANVLAGNSRVNFWIQSDATPDFADFATGVHASPTTVPASPTALAATDCQLNATGQTALAANTWYNCDVAMSSAATTATLNWHFQVNDVGGGANQNPAASDIFVDRVIVYNDKIRLRLAGDDIAASGAHTMSALLKDSGSTVATGYVTKTSSLAAEGGGAWIDFFPTTVIEISKGTSKTFTLQIDTETLLDEDAGSDDPLTVSMALGTASDGTVTSGDFWWNDTNNTKPTTYDASQGTVKWVGQVSNTTLNGNTLKY